MNAAQTAKYFFEWGRAREFFLGRGYSHAEADEQRHALHRKALGRDKSSKEFTNGDLDAVLAAFRAVWDGGNLDAQLDLGEMEARRKSGAIARLGALAPHAVDQAHLGTRYVQGIADKMFGTHQYQQLTSAQLARLEGVVLRRLKQRLSAERVERLVAEAEEAAAKVWAIVGPARAGMKCAAPEEETVERCPRCSVVVTIENAGGYRTYCAECTEQMFPEPAKAADDEGPF